MAEHTAGLQLLSAGAEGSVECEQALFVGVHGAAVITAQVMWKCLGSHFVVELCTLSHTQRNHEGALNFDLYVWQGVEKLFVCAVMEAERRAVRSSHRQVRLHGRVEKQWVSCR